ncbi:MAG: gfo/Idh/MocA family oxidoreductase, partial [Actinobacteria bacterium]|nr:gfo/Idh/MocA family oxidoreductase [Actinomycetota bacterium]
RLACSWNLHAGRDAVIEASFYGSNGAVSVRNVGGSFYDFRCERLRGTSTELLVEPPDDWSGRAAVDWARRLAAGECFDADAEEYVRVAALLDRIYGR